MAREDGDSTVGTATVPTGSTADDREAEEPARIGVVVLVDGGDVVRYGAPIRGRAVLGRDPGSELPVRDRRVSRAHAAFTLAGDAVILEDLGGRNGSIVDGRPLAEGARAPLRDGALLRFGHTLALVTHDYETKVRPFRDDVPLTGGGGLDLIREQIAVAGPSGMPVLVRGATGAGKELAARMLHEASGRRGELVALNCGAVPDALVESELFGHARGAYSGADRARPGLVRRADGGTLFLDEIAELPPPAQSALLRFLDSGEVRSVGEDAPRRADVRIVSATHRDLDALVASGSFRVDLLHRLAAFRLTLPSLEARREDIPELARRGLGGDELSLSASAIEALLLAAWPGNVRQLLSSVRAGALRARAAKAGRIEAEHLDLSSTPAAVGAEPPAPSVEAPRSPDDLDLDRLVRALEAHAGNVAAAATALGYSRSGLYLAMRRLGVDPATYRERGRS